MDRELMIRSYFNRYLFISKKWRRMEKRVENWNQVHSYKLNTKFLKTNIQLIRSIQKVHRFHLQLNSYESTVYSDIKHKIQKKVSFTSFTMQSLSYRLRTYISNIQGIYAQRVGYICPTRCVYILYNSGINILEIEYQCLITQVLISG